MRSSARAALFSGLTGLNYTASIVESFIDIPRTSTPSCCRIDDTHFAIAYFDTTPDITRLEIYSINLNGTGITKLKETNLGSIPAMDCKLGYLGNSTLVLAYQEQDFDDGFIKIYTFDASYNLTLRTTYEFDTTEGQPETLAVLNSTHFLLGYHKNSNFLLSSFSINGSYNITKEDTDTFIDSWGIKIEPLDETHYALLYRDADWIGNIGIYSLNASWDTSLVSTLSIGDEIVNGSADMALLDSGVLVVCQEWDMADHYVRTFSYDGSYNITLQDNNLLNTIPPNWVSITIIDNRHFLVFYDEGLNSTNFDLITIDDSLQVISITSYILDALEPNKPVACRLTETLSIVFRKANGSSKFGKISSILVS